MNINCFKSMIKEFKKKTKNNSSIVFTQNLSHLYFYVFFRSFSDKYFHCLRNYSILYYCKLSLWYVFILIQVPSD